MTTLKSVRMRQLKQLMIYIVYLRQIRSGRRRARASAFQGPSVVSFLFNFSFLTHIYILSSPILRLSVTFVRISKADESSSIPPRKE